MTKTGWQPIETAPKDGSRIIAWPVFSGEQSVAEVAWQERRRGGRWSPVFSSFKANPTHWMPLPEPPESAK